MLVTEGWQWDDIRFTSPDGTGRLSVYDRTGYALAYSDIRGLQTFGSGEAVQYTVRVDAGGYSSTEEVVSALVPDAVTVDATEWLNDRDCLIAFRGSSTGEGIACVWLDEEYGVYRFEVFNPEAVEQGVFEEWWGEDCGRSVDEVWHYLFGHGPGEEPAAVPAGALDADGNPTLLAITELSGAELCDMLVSQGWWWNNSQLVLTSPDGAGHLAVADRELSAIAYSDIRGLQAFGVGEPEMYMLEVDANDYSSVGDAVSTLVPDAAAVDSTEWLPNTEICLIAFHGTFEGEAIGAVTYDSDNDAYMTLILNPEAIEQGLFDKLWGDSCGTSVDEIWNTLFGHSL